jgi:hypothetical protein
MRMGYRIYNLNASNFPRLFFPPEQIYFLRIINCIHTIERVDTNPAASLYVKGKKLPKGLSR